MPDSRTGCPPWHPNLPKAAAGRRKGASPLFNGRLFTAPVRVVRNYDSNSSPAICAELCTITRLAPRTQRLS